MYRIPSILTSDEIIDKAFKRASKVQVTVKHRPQRQKKIAIAKVRKASNTICNTLNKYIRSFPSFDGIPIFYYELFDVTVGIDSMKNSLGALDWCRKKIEKIADESVENIQRSKGKARITAQLSASYGRFSSLIKQISDDLEFLASARENLIKAPLIDAEKSTIVVAGAPNVGKSLLVTKISTARPKIASYPFTTKGISVGHINSDDKTYQVIDTPGLLDREMEKRNEMEMKAILALRHLANTIVFIIDPSEHCGYSLDSQLCILSDIKARFMGIPILEVENKVDIIKTGTARIKISALEGTGLKMFLDILMGNMKRNNN